MFLPTFICADWLKQHLEEFVSAVILLFILKPAQIICVGNFWGVRGPQRSEARVSFPAFNSIKIQHFVF